MQRFIERMRCVPRILSVLNARSGRRLDEHDMRDVVQDTLMAVWKKLGLFEGRAALETWVYRFCLQEHLAAIRRQRRLPLTVSDCDDAGLPDEPLARAAEPLPPHAAPSDSVALGLARLGPPASDVIRLKHFGELTFDEIAASLGVSPNTAKTWYYRGLDKLRELLAPLRPSS